MMRTTKKKKTPCNALAYPFAQEREDTERAIVLIHGIPGAYGQLAYLIHKDSKNLRKSINC